ncbi:hypothetical protein KPH14_011441 [Odynerus spinipes]|uniref:G domain-containing protein n=1 Tax=Odynerus spinipes TaxID=1348599 RepID=A0AAD9RW49_9HYME|nr:hypothetical protein KPH14_011441 [Odynerus spinipes]
MSCAKIILHTKPRFLKFHTNDNVRHFWQLNLPKCLTSIQICHYSRKQGDNVLYPIDPKVKVLQNKLLYSEYLHYERIRLGFLKRLKFKRKLQEIQRKQNLAEQLHKTAYSVVLNHISSDNGSDSTIKQATEVSSLDNSKSHTIIHMPYASADSFKVVDASADKTKDVPEDIDNETDKSQFSLLNKEYKALYEKYLETKSLMQGQEKPSFIEYEGAYTKEKSIDLQNVPNNWMEDYEQYDDSQNPSDWLYGTPNKNTDISPIPCGGCGALLHCKDHALPGYLPSELFMGRTNEELKIMICQRCHFLKHYKTALDVKVSPEDYPELLKVIKTKKCAVIVMVDLTDFPSSIWPNIGNVLNPRTAIFLVGNKIDLLPKDSSDFDRHIKECMIKAVQRTGIKKSNIRYTALISAKTGYGIEELINKLHKMWKYKGDVYLIGCTNVGKSSLFNCLLQSDYCKVQAADLVQRATISPWPGTTLNLLKFPIMNPLKWKLSLRVKRLLAEREGRSAAEQIRCHKLKLSHNIKYATLQGFIGRTFVSRRTDTPQPLSDPFASQSHKHNASKFGLDETHPDYKHARWCYDTPGTIQSDQILDLLTTEELVMALPNSIISPRTFVLQPEQTIFIGGLGRLDYLEGNEFIRCTIFASYKLPITICHVIDADYLYKELLHTEAFIVPINDPERLKVWPSLQPKQMEVTGINETESAADVVLSNAGWIAITPNENDRVKLQGWTPNARGIYLRTPALLRKSVTLRGARVLGTPAYKKGKQVYAR